MKKRFGAKLNVFGNPKFYRSTFWGQKGWQPDKIYFIHSETCHYHICNIHENKTYWNKLISTEKEKTSILKFEPNKSLDYKKKQTRKTVN